MTVTVLVIGDVMLDEFVYGDAKRISPEAATPVLSIKRIERMIGGAGNVARGVKALGGKCILVSAIGDDETGKLVARLLTASGIEPRILTDATRPTTRKTRFVSEEYSSHLLRADSEAVSLLMPGSNRLLRDDAIAEIDNVDAVVLSDYGKGVISRDLAGAVIRYARSIGKPVIVDPKGIDFQKYAGATIITPNRHELGVPTATEEDLREAAMHIAACADTHAVLVTRGEQGMTLYNKDGDAMHVPGLPVRVRDVSGAGDTVVATLAVALGCGTSIPEAVTMANTAASIAVGKRGTATVSMGELTAPKGKIAPRNDWTLLFDKLYEWRRDGLSIGFTNGCFDVLHPGHVKLLREAHSMCDKLVVGLNSDESIRKLKGESRPVQTELARAEMLAAMEDVDLVVVFDTQDTLSELVKDVRPAVMVLGADHRDDHIEGSNLVDKIVFVELVPGQSTTKLLERGAAQ